MHVMNVHGGGVGGGGRLLSSHLSDPSSRKIRVLSEISCVIWRIKDEEWGLESVQTCRFVRPGRGDGTPLKRVKTVSPRWS